MTPQLAPTSPAPIAGVQKPSIVHRAIPYKNKQYLGLERNGKLADIVGEIKNFYQITTPNPQSRPGRHVFEKYGKPHAYDYVSVPASLKHEIISKYKPSSLWRPRPLLNYEPPASGGIPGSEKKNP